MANPREELGVGRDGLLEELNILRDEVDENDARSRALRAKRFAITRRIGEIKVALGLSLVDPDREVEVIKQARAGGERHGLDPDMEAKLARTVMDQVVVEHQRIADEVVRDVNAAS